MGFSIAKRMLDWLWWQTFDLTSAMMSTLSNRLLAKAYRTTATLWVFGL